jgi:WD40 repeat protein
LSEVWTLAFSPDGQKLVSGARDGGVKLWQTRRRSKEDVLPGAWQPLAFSKDSRTLAAWNGQATVAFFNAATLEASQEFQLEAHRPGPRAWPSLSADLDTLAEGLPDGQVKLWNTQTRESTTLRVSEAPVGFSTLSPSGRELITGGFKQPLRWWDLRAGTNSLLPAEAYRVLFSPEGRTVAAFSRGEPPQLWDAATRSLRATLASSQPGGFAAAFSPDGRILATTSDLSEVDDAIHLWDAWTGKLLGACTGHKQPVFSIAFCPESRTLASASDDSTLKLWNVASGQELLTIRRLGGALSGLIFSPDGTLLAGAKPFFLQPAELRFLRAPRLAEIDRLAVTTSAPGPNPKSQSPNPKETPSPKPRGPSPPE